jgi:hypothetical protein
MPFRGNEIAHREIPHVAAERLNAANKLMPHDHGDGDGLLRPGVPVPDVDVRAADGGPQDLDADVVDAIGRFGLFLQPQPFPCVAFDKCLHANPLLVETKTGQTTPLLSALS